MGNGMQNVKNQKRKNGKKCNYYRVVKGEKMKRLFCITIMICLILTGCGKQVESAIPEPQTTVEPVTYYSDELGIYTLGGTVVTADGNTDPRYKLDTIRNIVQIEDGTIVILRENTKEFTCAMDVDIVNETQPMLKEMKTTDGKTILESSKYTASVYLLPHSVINTDVYIKVSGGSAVPEKEKVEWDHNGFGTIKLEVTEKDPFDIILVNALGEVVKLIAVKPEIQSIPETIECEHMYNDRVVEPTLNARGYISHTCIKCGANYKDSYSPAIPHDCEMTQTMVPSTCNQNGYTLGVCKICGRTEKTDLLPQLPHSYTINSVPKTCTQDGYTEKICSVCGYRTTEIIVKCTGHLFETAVIQPTETAGGYSVHTCSVCGYSYTDSYTESIAKQNTSANTTNSNTNKGNASLEEKGLNVNSERNKDNSSYDWSVSYPGSTSEEDLNRHSEEAVDSTIDVLKNYMKQDGLSDAEIEQGIQGLEYNTVVEYDPNTDTYNIYVVYG